jgi:hypothetical protein
VVLIIGLSRRKRERKAVFEKTYVWVKGLPLASYDQPSPLKNSAEICYMYMFKDSIMKSTKHCIKKGGGGKKE